MKLNAQQKKWGLTFGLVAALGFNLSSPLQETMQALDLASTTASACSAETKNESIICQKLGDKKTRITILKKDAEGNVVTTCKDGSCVRSAVVDASIDDIAAINRKIGELIATKKSLPPETEVETSRDRRERDRKRDRDDSDLEKAQEIAFREILDKCDDKKDEDDADTDASLTSRMYVTRMSSTRDKYAYCLGDNLSRTLQKCVQTRGHDLGKSVSCKSAGAKKIASKDATEFFKEHMASYIVKKVGNGGNLAANTTWASRVLNDFLKEIPKEYNGLRSGVEKAAAQVIEVNALQIHSIRQEANDIRSQADMYNQLARSAQNPLERQQYQMQAQRLEMNARLLDSRVASSFQTLTSTIIPGMRSSLYNGLSTSVQNRMTTMDVLRSIMRSYDTDTRSILDHYYTIAGLKAGTDPNAANKSGANLPSQEILNKRVREQNKRAGSTPTPFAPAAGGGYPRQHFEATKK